MLTSDYKILPGVAHVGIQTTRSYLEVHMLTSDYKILPGGAHVDIRLQDLTWRCTC
jgi:hypothetical protein